MTQTLNLNGATISFAEIEGITSDHSNLTLWMKGGGQMDFGFPDSQETWQVIQQVAVGCLKRDG